MLYKAHNSECTAVVVMCLSIKCHFKKERTNKYDTYLCPRGASGEHRCFVVIDVHEHVAGRVEQPGLEALHSVAQTAGGPQLLSRVRRHRRQAHGGAGRLRSSRGELRL